METEDYVNIIKATSVGNGNWADVILEENADQEGESSIFFRLTPRQRSIMSLSSQGKSAQEVATHLDLSYSYVRKELSRAYAILLPDASASDDLKTKAVLKYMELMRIN